MQRSNGNVGIHLGTGMFWFWQDPWWTELEEITTARRRIGGLQILCEPVHSRPPLPPVGIVRQVTETTAVSLHPSFFDPGSIVYTPEIDAALERLNAWLVATGVRDVVVHGNHFARGQEDVEAFRERLPGRRLLIENVGARSQFGHAPDEVAALLALDDSIGFVLDIAHVSELLPSVRDVRVWLDHPLLAERLCMVHVSASGIAHPELRAGCPPEIGPADHLPAFLRPDVTADIRSRLAQYPLVAEGCLPRGSIGQKWLDLEIDYLAQWAA